MKKHKLDKTFGIHPQAFAIAKLIHFSTGRPVHWSPFYNGRERGICLSVGKKTWVFGKHRNSDQLFLDRIQDSKSDYQLNPPILQDMTDKIYCNRQFFRYDEAQKVANTIMSEIPA